jgi:hypothetical protein
MLDALREFLMGPVFVFSIAMALLGLLRLIFLRICFIVSAFYNSWNDIENHGALIKRVLSYGLPHKFIQLRFEIRTFILVIVYSITFIIPFFVLDHLSLLEKFYGIRLIGFSKSFTLLLLLIPLLLAVIKIRHSLGKSKNRVGSKNDLWFWSFLLLVYVTGVLAQNTNQPALLRFIRVLHVLTGDILIFIIPFSRIGYWLIYPLINITTRGIRLLPDAKKRNETSAYFKSLMENKQ